MSPVKHGHDRRGARTREYATWHDMIARCKNRNTEKYMSYGGRGISVCDRWLRFENFLEDMGKKPIGATIDRINNNGDYEPGNCRWAPVSVQQRNRRYKKNKLGFIWVEFRRGKYTAKIRRNYKMIHLGTFETVEQAGKAYENARNVAIAEDMKKFDGTLGANQ